MPDPVLVATTVRLTFTLGSTEKVAFQGAKTKALAALRSQHPRSTVKVTEPGQIVIYTANQLDLTVTVEGALRTIWLAPAFKAYLRSLAASNRQLIEDTMPSEVMVEKRRGRGGTSYYALCEIDFQQWLDEIGKLNSGLQKEIERTRLWYKVRNVVCDASSTNAALAGVSGLLNGQADGLPRLKDEDGKWTVTVPLKHHDKPLIVEVRRRPN